MTRYPYYERTIHYYETDRMGVVHHSNYARILEDCRIDMMAYYGLPYAELERMGYNQLNYHPRYNRCILHLFLVIRLLPEP